MTLRKRTRPSDSEGYAHIHYHENRLRAGLMMIGTTLCALPHRQTPPAAEPNTYVQRR